MTGQRSPLEHELARLGDSIATGERHRDETLSRATQSNSENRRRKRAARITIAISAVLILLSPLISRFTRIEVPQPPTASEVNQATLERAESHHMTYDWALVDVIREFSLSRFW